MLLKKMLEWNVNKSKTTSNGWIWSRCTLRVSIWKAFGPSIQAKAAFSTIKYWFLSKQNFQNIYVWEHYLLVLGMSLTKFFECRSNLNPLTLGIWRYQFWSETYIFKIAAEDSQCFFLVIKLLTEFTFISDGWFDLPLSTFVMLTDKINVQHRLKIRSCKLNVWHTATLCEWGRELELSKSVYCCQPGHQKSVLLNLVCPKHFSQSQPQAKCYISCCKGE